jgi:hypothetical protein
MVPPTNAAWHTRDILRRDILPIVSATLETPAAQAKLMALAHYLTEGR